MRHPLALILLLALGCGRTLIYDCHLAVSPAALDFGDVEVGSSATQQITLSSLENGGCHVNQLALGADTGPGFALATTQVTDFFVPPGQSLTIPVTFAPASAAPSLKRTGTVTFQTGDPLSLNATVPLSAEVPQCILAVAPVTLDFGQVALGLPATLQATLTNTGTLTCQPSDFAFGPNSDPEFTLAGSLPQSIAPGASATVAVAFEATTSALPLSRTGTLTFKTGAPQMPSASIALLALIPKCTLEVSPLSLNLGNVPLNGSRSGTVTLTNDGGVPCEVSEIALAAGSDPDFSLPAQPLSYSIAPGSSDTLTVDFNDLGGATPPLTHTGTLTFETGDLVAPDASVPLSAFIATACTDGGQWIYVVDQETSVLSAFHPDTLTFDDIGVLDCPAPLGFTPFSMGVDQSGVAWVLYSQMDGTGTGELFQVDTVTTACQATTFQGGQQDFNLFGMGFSFQPLTDLDTLFIAGGPTVFSSTNLGTIAFPSLTVTDVAPLSVSSPELTGTGDGELWGFVPPSNTQLSLMEQLDTTSGDALTTYSLDQISGNPSEWAVGFYGGAFWIFLASDANGGTTTVYEVQRSNGAFSVALANTGRHISGAGVSTCAPLE